MTAFIAIKGEPWSTVESQRQSAYRKVSWRIVPLLMLCYTAIVIYQILIGQELQARLQSAP